MANDDEAASRGTATPFGREEGQWKRQLGTLWRVASSGMDTLRDVVVKSSQEGRLRIDLAVYERERRDLLQEIGRAVLQLADAGRIELPESLAGTIMRLRQVEDRISHDAARINDNAFGAPRGMGPDVSDVGDDPDESP